MAVLAASIAFFAIVATAGLAVTWIIEDQRSAPTNRVLGASVAPELPPNLIAVQRMNSIREFEQAGGFTPFIPMYVPGSTQTDFALSLTLPHEGEQRVGRVSYSTKGV